MDLQKKKIKEIKLVDKDIEILRIVVEIAEKSIEDDSNELSNCLKWNMLDRKEIQITPSKLEMGIRRKHNLQEK